MRNYVLLLALGYTQSRTNSQKMEEAIDLKKQEAFRQRTTVAESRPEASL